MVAVILFCFYILITMYCLLLLLINTYPYSLIHANSATCNSTTRPIFDTIWYVPLIEETNSPYRQQLGDCIIAIDYDDTGTWKISGSTSYAVSSKNFLEPRYFEFDINHGLKCSQVTGQYDVTLSDSVMRNPKVLTNTLHDLTQDVTRSGVKVTNVYENIGIFVIKSMDQHVLDKVIDDLRQDPRIASVEPTMCVQTNSLGS